jgi:hypothetical protein
MADDYERPKRPPHDHHEPIPVPKVPRKGRDESIHTGRVSEDVKEKRDDLAPA